MKKPLFFGLTISLGCLGGDRSLAQESTLSPPPLKSAWLSTKYPGAEILHAVEIGTGGGRPLHVEVAKPEGPSSHPLPAIIWIHGGGWREGSNTELPAWLATHGYFTVSVEYRLSGEAKWPAQLEDAKLAVRWLRANASKYNVDPNRIGVWGASAGGHLAACLGTMPDDSEFEGQGGYPDTSSRVQAVADFFGPVDLTDSAIDPKLKEAMNTLFGASIDQNPGVWQKASPLFAVKAGDPPFLIMHGDKDQTVDPSQSAKMTAALEKAGVPVVQVIVKGASHGFIREKPNQAPLDPDTETLKKQFLSFFDKYLKS